MGRTALVLIAALVGMVGCRSHPTPGARCRVLDQFVCDAPNAALVCEAPENAANSTGEPVWTAVACRGPRGCSGATASGSADCDDTTASEGEACPRSPPVDYACTPDHARALSCQNGKFVLWRACRGPDACVVEGGRNVHCDTTMGEPGDPCGQPNTYSCSVDGQSMLECGDGGTLSSTSSCRGPAGCRVQRDARKVDCDDARANEGDACDQDNRIACSMDAKAELVCTGHTFTKKRECRRSDCRLDGSELFCE